MLFVESPETEDEMATIGRELGDKPLIANMVEGGRTPMLSNARLAEIGYALAIYPVAGLLSAAAALETVYRQIRETGSSLGSSAPLYSFSRDEPADGIRGGVGVQQSPRRGLSERANPCGSACAVAYAVSSKPAHNAGLNCTLASRLTDKRYDLLRHLHRRRAVSIRAARARTRPRLRAGSRGRDRPRGDRRALDTAGCAGCMRSLGPKSPRIGVCPGGRVIARSEATWRSNADAANRASGCFAALSSGTSRPPASTTCLTISAAIQRILAPICAPPLNSRQKLSDQLPDPSATGRLPANRRCRPFPCGLGSERPARCLPSNPGSAR